MTIRAMIFLVVAIIVGVGLYYGAALFVGPTPHDPLPGPDKTFRQFLSELERARKLQAAGKVEQAERALLQVLADYRNNPTVAHSILEPRFDLARLYEQQQQAARAEEQYKIIIDGATSPNTVVRARMELCRLKAHNHDDKLRELRAMLEEFKDTPQVAGGICVRLAEALLARKRYGEVADITCETLLADNAGDVSVRTRLQEQANEALAAMAQAAAGPAEAAEVYVAHVKKHPGLPTICWSWLEKAGLLFIKAGEYGRARNAFNRIVRDYPGEGGGQAEVGRTLVGDLDNAERKAATRLTEEGTDARLKKGEKIRVIRGEITQPTQWSPDNGTYVVVGKVAVRKGAQLVIDPGTRVEFTLHAALVVYGRIAAKGTAGAPVVFTSAAGEPSFFDWNGVRLVESSDSMLEHVVISRAQKGLTCTESNPRLDSVTVTACGLAAVEAEESSPVIIDPRITANPGGGLVFIGSGGSVEGGRVSNNGKAGISARKASAPAIAGTVIVGNGAAGVECLDGSKLRMRSAIVSDNLGPGIRVTMYSEPTITGGEISRNAGAAVEWSNGSQGKIVGSKIIANRGGVNCSVFSSPLIEKCTFQENDLYAVRCESASDPRIRECRFASLNGPAILVLDICAPKVEKNVFPPRGVAVRHEGDRDLDASDNLWPRGVELTGLVRATGKGKVILP